ncbi:MAG: polysaccharide deacetylase [Alphaproteobacteria bacterium]|nr:polysaccharide deacetylase [Alphaproteobacteria bacterium]
MPRLPAPLLFALLCLGLSQAPASSETTDESRQLVIVSFDGAHDNELWQRSREIAEGTGARFTYFLSCTFLIHRDDGKSYRAPGQKAGRSNVGFAQSTAEVRDRLNHIWAARAERHEIASHGCGHFDGGSWSKLQWKKEFGTFSSILEAAWANAGEPDNEPPEWRDFVQNEIAGFRAPYLSTNENMFSALKEAGFRYDASGVSRGPAMPGGPDDFKTFELPLIPEGPRNRRVIAMDYNLFIRHSAGLENASQTRQFEERTYQAFRRAFDKEHKGARRPFQIGMHFVEMNGGAYWRALERLLSDVCGMPDVDCVTYGEAIKHLGRRAEGGGA